MANIYGTGAKAKATMLHSRVIRARGHCEHCGESRREVLQCAHIISRSYAATRTDEANAFCLCASCHAKFTANPIEFARWAISQIGDDSYDLLYRKAQAGIGKKVDWQSEVERLTLALVEQ